MSEAGIELDPLELEHVVGYTGRYAHTLHCHPDEESRFVCCLGTYVVLGDVTDPHQQEFLRAHDNTVSALDLSPSGRLIASGQIGSLRSPACLDGTGGSLLLGTEAGELASFDLRTGTYRASFPAASHGVLSLALQDDGTVLVGGGDGSLRRLRGSGIRWMCVGEAPDPMLPGPVVALAPAPGSGWCLAGTHWGHLLRVAVSEASLAAVELEQSHTAPVRCCLFAPGHTDLVATGSADGTIRVWSLSDYGVEHVLRGPADGAALALAFDTAGDDEPPRGLLGGWDDGCIRYYPWGSSGSAAWQLEAHRGAVRSLAAKKSFFVSGGDDGRVCVWAKGSRELLLCFEEHRGAVLEVAPDVSDLSMLHSVGRDRSIFTFSLKEERRVAAHQLPKATAAGFTSLSQRRLGELELVTGAADGRLLLWDVDVPDRPTEEAPSRATVAVTRVAVSPSGRFLAVGDEKGRLRVHDAQTLEPLMEKPAHSSALCALAWSPDERQLVTGGEDCCAAVFNFYAAD